jgi:hypothetical protein
MSSNSKDSCISTSNSTINLGNPFYLEHKTTTGKPVFVNGTHEAKAPFSGNGIVRGISFVGDPSISQDTLKIRPVLTVN